MEKIVSNVIDIGVNTNSRTKSVKLKQVKNLAEQRFIAVRSDAKQNLPVIKYKTEIYMYSFVKRTFDIAVGLVGVTLLLPIMGIVKIANLINHDNEPVLLKQKRIGKNGKDIYIYKIRSMIPNAEQFLDIILENNPDLKEEYDRNKKLERDPRVTKVGAFIRKTSLDEFGQFINVLKGDMSVVGPRPYLEREKEDMGRYYKEIVKCKPGLTGLWQVEGRSNVGFMDRCRIDKFYNRNKGLWLDTKIFFRTFMVVFKRVGAK